MRDKFIVEIVTILDEDVDLTDCGLLIVDDSGGADFVSMQEVAEA